MSDRALRHIVRLHGISPLDKLLLLCIAANYREAEQRSTPSMQRLCAETGMGPEQISRHSRDLSRRGLLVLHGDGYEIPSLTPPPFAGPIPDDWLPSPSTIEQVERDFPLHSFDIREATDDFRSYTQRRGLRIAPDERDDAFRRNICSLLARRQPGRVRIGAPPGPGGPSSLYAFLSGSD